MTPWGHEQCDRDVFDENWIDPSEHSGFQFCTGRYNDPLPEKYDEHTGCTHREWIEETRP